MRIGDVIPAALWYNNDNPKEKTDAERGITEVINGIAAEEEVKIGPFHWDDVDPLSPRVPEPPKHYQGDARCLIGEVVVIGHMKDPSKDFASDLEEDDLQRLRAITREKMGPLTDDECDDQINEWGPEVAYEETLQ
jgi:hypothetical protein